VAQHQCRTSQGLTAVRTDPGPQTGSAGISVARARIWRGMRDSAASVFAASQSARPSATRALTCPLDRVNRRSRRQLPRRGSPEFTMSRNWAGFVYVDGSDRKCSPETRPVAVSRTAPCPFRTGALEQAIHARCISEARHVGPSFGQRAPNTSPLAIGRLDEPGLSLRSAVRLTAKTMPLAKPSTACQPSDPQAGMENPSKAWNTPTLDMGRMVQ